MPLYTENGIVVTLKFPYLIGHHSDIKELDFLVFWAGKNVMSINWIPFCLLNDGCVGSKFKDALSCAVSRVPDTHGKVFATSDNKRLKRMPITSDDIWPMLLEFHLLFRCGEIPNSRSSMVRTCDKFYRAHGKTQISDARVIVRPKPIFNNKLVVAIDHKAMFVSRDEILVVVWPRNGLNSLVVYITTRIKLEMISIPNNDLAWTRGGHNLFAVFLPFELIKWLVMFILALTQETRTHSRSIIWIIEIIHRLFNGFICGINVFCISVAGIHCWAVIRIKIIVVLQFIVMNLIIIWINLLLLICTFLRQVMLPSKHLILVALHKVLDRIIVHHSFKIKKLICYKILIDNYKCD